MSTTYTISELLAKAREAGAAGQHTIMFSHEQLAAFTEKIRQAVTAAPQEGVSVPPGYVLVPLEPDGAMWSASRREFIKFAQQYEDAPTAERASIVGDIAGPDIYRAMVAAAPQPPASALPLAVGVNWQELAESEGSRAVMLVRQRRDLQRDALRITELLADAKQEHDLCGPATRTLIVEAHLIAKAMTGKLPNSPKSAAPPSLSPPATGNVGSIPEEQEKFAAAFKEHALKSGPFVHALYNHSRDEIRLTDTGSWIQYATRLLMKGAELLAAPPGRGMVPLTDFHRDAIWQRYCPGEDFTPAHAAFSKGIEEAHGITAAAATALGDGEGGT